MTSTLNCRHCRLKWGWLDPLVVWIQASFWPAADSSQNAVVPPLEAMPYIESHRKRRELPDDTQLLEELRRNAQGERLSKWAVVGATLAAYRNLVVLALQKSGNDGT